MLFPDVVVPVNDATKPDDAGKIFVNPVVLGADEGLAMVVVEDTAVVSGFTREAAAANFCIFESVANCEPVPQLDTGKKPVT